MNERIRELAKQAGFYPENNWDHTNWHAAGHNPTFEKFAELIVAECVKLQYKNVVVGGVSDYNRGRRELTEDIQKHFGVEE
jgi:hypothetical protein